MDNHECMMKPNRIVLPSLLIGACLLASVAEAGPRLLDGDENAARTAAVDTTFTNNEFPILNIRNVNGNAVLVEGLEIEDIFSYSSTATEVVVTIVPPSGDSITVTTLSGPTWYEDSASGEWEAVFTIPSPGNETTGTYEIELDSGGQSTGAGHFKIKKQGNGGGSGQ
jgi:hypothetical protein